MPDDISSEQIEKTLTDQIAEILGRAPNDVSPDDPLASLGIDSIRLVEILIFVEREFGVKLMDAGLDRKALQSPASLARKIAEIRRASTAP